MAAPRSDEWTVGALTSGIATFGVRFESQDDFLVEYTDNLRHGVLRLPLSPPPVVGTPVRLRVRLPDDVALYLTGRVAEVGADETRVTLDPFTKSQQGSLERCLARLLGPVEGASASSRGDASRLDQRQISVLLVDDSVTHRLELGDALRARGLRVRVAENGLVALAGALKRLPDIILTDVEMPQMDGWALLRAVRQRKRLQHLPVVFLTRLSDELSRLRGYRMGVDDYLSKLTPPDEITAHLLGAVARRQQVAPPVTDPTRCLRGNLEHVRLGSLLAFLENERRSGSLTLRNGEDHATLHLRDGALECIDNLGDSGDFKERAIALLEWRAGHFEFFAGTTGAAARRSSADTTTSVSFLLMEHARRTDEAKSEDTTSI